MVVSFVAGFKPLHKAGEDAVIGLNKDRLLAEHMVFKVVSKGY